MQLQALAAAKDMPESRQRDVEMVVHRLPHERPALLFDADHGHRRVLDLKRLSYRIAALKEFLLHLRPDHAYRRRMFDLMRSDETALGDILLLDVYHIR